jgi:Cu2+-exporting ATPase
VFDKTGTLTEGRMSVAVMHSAAGTETSDILRSAAAAERYSEHAAARAIITEADMRKLNFRNVAVQGFHATPGLGVQAEVDGKIVLLGSLDWLTGNGIVPDAGLQAHALELEARGTSCMHCASGAVHVAVFGLADRNELRAAGIGMTLLSGDRKTVAESIAQQLGGMDVIAEVLPQDKDREIQRLQQSGAVVAMVGDGVNDAPALIRADVGIALGSGTDVSVESADIVLMHNGLDKVRMATLLSRRTLRTIRQNIGLSFLYNVIMVPLAMMAKVDPLVAAISMPISSLVVIGNAARIRNLFKREKSQEMR